MPDAAGNIKGSGWSREREAGWERAFGGSHHDRRLRRRLEDPGFREAYERELAALRDPAPEGAGSDEG